LPAFSAFSVSFLLLLWTPLLVRDTEVKQAIITFDVLAVIVLIAWLSYYTSRPNVRQTLAAFFRCDEPFEDSPIKLFLRKCCLLFSGDQPLPSYQRIPTAPDDSAEMGIELPPAE
jgi:hypothetical protein